MVYLCNPGRPEYDQQLISFQVGQLEVGPVEFTVEVPPPDFRGFPQKEDLLGVSAFVLDVSYKGKEFFRVGYFVYHHYASPVFIENDPPEVMIEDVVRNVLTEKPRITRFDVEIAKPAMPTIPEDPLVEELRRNSKAPTKMLISWANLELLIYFLSG